jgi:hypothetical protein
MTTKHLCLLVAGSALMFSACQAPPSPSGVDTASASVSLSEITHEPLGNAVLREEGGQLFATGMRTIKDGVRSLYQPSVQWEAELDWADDVSAIRLNAINSRLSGEDTITSLALDRVGEDTWELGADFISPNYRVNVYDGDRLVGTVLPSLAQPVQLHVNLTIIVWWRWKLIIIVFLDSAQGADTTEQQLCTFELETPEGIEVTQGDTVLRGTRIEIIEDPHEAYGGLDELQVLGNGDVTYLSEEMVAE